MNAIRRGRQEMESGQSVTHSSIGGHNIQIGSAADVAILLDRPDYRLEFLEPMSADHVRPPRSQQQPSYLLNPGWQVVPFHSRPEEQRLLQSWRDSPESTLSVLWLHGPGGQGKTRLGSWFCSDSYSEGWAVAQASERTPRLSAGRPLKEPLTEDQPLLVVVDYADRWRLAVLAQMVDNLALDYSSRRIRILLLARPGMRVWNDVAAELDHGGVDLAEPIGLGAFAAGSHERIAAFTEAASAFARRLQASEVIPAPPSDLNDEAYGSPLTLHMAALARVCAARESESPPDHSDLSRYLLLHERRFWLAAAGQLSGSGSGLDIERLVFVATAVGPTTHKTGLAFVRTARLADGDAEAERLLALHHQLYPVRNLRSKTEDTWVKKATLEPLRPDRIGEDFIGQHLAQFSYDWELLADLLVQVEGATARADSVSVRQCLVVLTAAAARHEAASNCLFAILGRYPKLAECAPAPTIRLVTERAPLDLAEAVEGALPANAELVRPARDLARRLYTSLAPGCRPGVRARRLLALANRVSHAGDDREALTLAKEAVEIYRQLANTEPSAYLEHLAVALHVLGDRLADSGNLRAGIEAAREGSQILMNLTGTDIRRLVLLAGSLHNLSHHYGRLGDKQSALKLALQAVEIYRNLEAEVRGPFTSSLGQALNTLSVAMTEVGDRRMALAPASEAVEIYRHLAEVNRATYLAPLASSLNNLGLSFMGVGDHERAHPALDQAIEIYDGIAELEPAAYLPTLAQVLNNLGASLVTAGKCENAIEPIQRAVFIRRRLAAVDPVHLPGLASSLINLSSALGLIGDEAAIEPGLEATGIYDHLVRDEPAYLHQLAGALNNLGSSWAHLGQVDAALATTSDAVSIRKHLVETEPAHRPDLAQALLVAAWVRGSYGADLEHAVTHIHEAIEIYTDLADQLPDVFSASLQSAYSLRADIVRQANEAANPNSVDRPDA